MESIATILTTWRGSVRTEARTRDIIRARYGAKAADAYDPRTNAMTYKCWLAQNRRVRKGEKSIPSFTVIEKRNSKGEIVKHAKVVHLFFITQTEPIEQQKQQKL